MTPGHLCKHSKEVCLGDSHLIEVPPPINTGKFSVLSFTINDSTFTTQNSIIPLKKGFLADTAELNNCRKGKT